MTNSSRKILLGLLAASLPALALAQSQPAKPAPPPRPRPIVITTPTPNQQWQRQVDRQQMQDRQNQNALREQLRQGSLDRQRANTTDPALRNQLDAADRSQQQLYRARQDAAARQYQTSPQPDQTRTVPARAGTAGR
ncbi:hypothetical protein [Luteibacter sp. SG786]|uniref:hypothetical protein n=1 Tax=Luteibacter sp. SG786 TaxID=2587130 RepID=UPI00141E14BD|nr:hypothetical protein [Luteibacter sp. SG786]NII53135.1 type IV secretory pathway VirB10-like protein [Luteibacter sp. SG786]